MTLEGLVIAKSIRNVRVRTDEGEIRCSIRGRFREAEGDGRLPIVVGDRVRLTRIDEDEAVVEEVLPRRTELRRARAIAGRHGSGRRKSSRPGQRAVEIVVAANVDQVLCVQAAVSPAPSWSLVDRVLISSEAEGVSPGICLSKWDQLEEDADALADSESCLGVYEALGYSAFRTSALARTGLEPLAAWFHDRVTVLSGHSGVGKSTLLNALIPGLQLPTGNVSATTGKGRHVTSAVSLYDLPSGGILIDTPGYREYGLAELGPADLGRHYPEFRPFLGDCRFNDCLHVDEPRCAIVQAFEAGEIHELRYDNYLRILDSL